MKAKKYWILVAIAVISLTGLWGIAAVGDYRDFINSKTHIAIDRQEVLTGLVGVTPQVSIFSSTDVPCNLTKHELQTQVELCLRQSGIKVFSEISEKDSNSLSGLSVSVTLWTFKPLAPAYVVESRVELREAVFLFRNPQMATTGTTWKGFPSSSCLREVPTRTEILEVVNRSVDEFINDYLAANPKK